MSSSAILGIGTVSMWGFTPALDLEQIFGSDNAEEPFNILLIGQSDVRHVLKTISARLKGPDGRSSSIKFFIVESCLENYARQILQIALACFPENQLGLHEKTIHFLELYGNVLIRPQTKRTLKTLCEKLIKFVTDDKNLKHDVIVNLLDFEYMKFRERDALVDILEQWNTTCDKVAMKDQWDKRLRAYLDTRYDSRLGIFDWDYNMKLMEKDLKTKIIHSAEYKQWRNSGQAFTEFESDYSQSNVTMTSTTGISNRYSGDIVTGPFISFGIESDNTCLFEKVNEQFKNRSYNVSYDNVSQIMSSFSERDFDDLSITFLPLGSSNSLHTRKEFISKFHGIYIASHMGQNVTSSLMQVLRPNGHVLIEKPRYLIEFRKEHHQMFLDTLTKLVNETGVLKACSFAPNEELDYMQFVKSDDINSSTTTPEDQDVCSQENPSSPLHLTSPET